MTARTNKNRKPLQSTGMAIEYDKFSKYYFVVDINNKGKYSIPIRGVHFWDDKDDLISTLKNLGFTIKEDVLYK